VQSVKFHEKRLNRIVTHTGADDIVAAHKNAARQANWKDGDPLFILSLEVEFTYSNVLPSNLPVSTVVSLPTVEQQQHVPLDQRHGWLNEVIRDLMVLHLSGDEEWGVNYTCKNPRKAMPRLRYQGDAIQVPAALEEIKKAVMAHKFYTDAPVSPPDIIRLIRLKINDQRKNYGPGVTRKGEETRDIKHKLVIAEMKRRRLVKEAKEAATYQNTMAARMIEQRLANASDAGLSTGTLVSTPFARAAPALHGPLALPMPVEGRQPPPPPPFVPTGTHAGDGVGDAGDDAGDTGARCDSDDEDDLGFDGDHHTPHFVRGPRTANKVRYGSINSLPSFVALIISNNGTRTSFIELLAAILAKNTSVSNPGVCSNTLGSQK